MSKNDDSFFNINKSGLEFTKPNILQMFGSYIITDPKGELCRDTAGLDSCMSIDKKINTKSKAI